MLFSLTIIAKIGYRTGKSSKFEPARINDKREVGGIEQFGFVLLGTSKQLKIPDVFSFSLIENQTFDWSARVWVTELTRKRPRSLCLSCSRNIRSIIEVSTVQQTGLS